jgi:ABC-type multidrug transport system fused ATPase/permease subunit
MFATVRVLLGVLDVVGVLLIGGLLAKSVNSYNSGSIDATSSASKLLAVLNNFSLLEIALLAASAFILKSLSSALLTKVMYKTFAETEAKLATEAFDYLLMNMSSSVRKYSKSDMHFLLTSSVSATMEILATFVVIISEIFFLSIMLISFSIINLTATIFTIIYFLLISILLHFYLGKRFTSAGEVSSKSAILTSTVIYNTIESFREVLTLNREQHFLSKFKKPKFESSQASFEVQYLMNLPRYIVESALLLGALGIIFISFKANNIEQSAQSIGIFLTGAMRIMASLLPLQNNFAFSKNQAARAEKFLEFDSTTRFKEYQQNKTGNSGFTEKHSKSVGVTVDNLKFSYGNSLPLVIKDVSLRIEPGQFVAIIGPSGAGKSSLADLLVGIFKPLSGRIQYFDELGILVTTDDFQFGYVPQNPGSIYGSIKDNIAFGVEALNVNQLDLVESIKMANLKAVIDDLEDGVETHLGEQSNALSGGQMQRIGLARAIYVKPNFLVLDEATSALDVETEAAVSTSLEDLRGKCTVVVIAHRLTTVQNADVVFVMNEGEVVAQGKFSDLAKSSEMVAKYVALSNLKTS